MLPWRTPKLTIYVVLLFGHPRRLQAFLDGLKVEIPKIPGIE
ncbi:MAG: hypothetical protein AAF572_15215 [Cyanobacteria bacterium P01_B01_bin.77]